MLPITLFISILAAYVLAYEHGSTYGGSGPFKSYFFEVESLPNHTFYQPLESGLRSPSCSLMLPVILWGNGGCDPCMLFCTIVLPTINIYQAEEGVVVSMIHLQRTANNTAITVGLKFRNFLGEVTSWGAIAIATGPVYIDPTTYVDTKPNATSDDTLPGENPGAITDAIDWVYENAGKGDWKCIDKTRIGVWGQSCGGLEAYAAGAQDDRVSHLGIFNSGQITVNASQVIASKITKPIFYALGGPTDVAYPNGERDYADLPATTPKWKGNHALGHSAAFDYPNAGIPGITGAHLVQWILRGNETAKEWFIGPGANLTGFQDVVYENLDKVQVTAI